MARRVLFLMLLIVIGACASGRGGSALYRRDVGTASGLDALSIGRQIMDRYAYEIETLDTIPDIRVVTHWKQRRPFQDEAELGITAAESRMIISGRHRGQTEMGSFYAVTVTLENRVRVPSSPDWNESTNTPMFRAHADEITNEYRRLITNIGVRRY